VGATIRDLVTELAASTPTQEELAARHAAATAHLRELLCPNLDDNDLADGERFWRELETRASSSVSLDRATGDSTE
jgi:hypothetical protein